NLHVTMEIRIWKFGFVIKKNLFMLGFAVSQLTNSTSFQLLQSYNEFGAFFTFSNKPMEESYKKNLMSFCSLTMNLAPFLRFQTNQCKNLISFKILFEFCEVLQFHNEFGAFFTFSNKPIEESYEVLQFHNEFGAFFTFSNKPIEESYELLQSYNEFGAFFTFSNKPMEESYKKNLMRFSSFQANLAPFLRFHTNEGMYLMRFAYLRINLALNLTFSQVFKSFWIL
ncbi:hypothetical protein DERP_005147, partial [Dermatophagoides pteronyssinus]